MSTLPIIIYPNPILKRKTEKIKDPKSPEIQELILDMLETLKKSDGVGLAANQVGNSVRLSVVKYEGRTYILINPRIKSKSWKKIIFEEGCLSFPGIHIPVKRHAKISIGALNKSGKSVEIKATGMLARIFQHEVDHLDGILFTKRQVKIKAKKLPKSV